MLVFHLHQAFQQLYYLIGARDETHFQERLGSIVTLIGDKQTSRFAPSVVRNLRYLFSTRTIQDQAFQQLCYLIGARNESNKIQTHYQHQVLELT